MKKLFILLILVSATAYADTTLDVAWTIYHEARGESTRGKMAVATVIMNRAAERNMSLSAVCRQRKQFSCWNSGRVPHTINSVVWEQCEQLARCVVKGYFKPTNDWNHYYNPDLCSPSWGDKMTNVKMVGNHKFGHL